MQYRIPTIFWLAAPLVAGAWSTMALAQYRCDIAGRSVVQSEPCPVTAKQGKYRCYVDGEVVYSDASCTTIKSKDTLAKEAKAADDAEVARRKAAAAINEVADRPNADYRISLAKRVVARQLRDPDSARFLAARVSWYSGIPVVCGLVSGRNGFGGYSQPVQFFAIDTLAEIDDGKSYKGFDAQWEKHCGPV